MAVGIVAAAAVVVQQTFEVGVGIEAAGAYAAAEVEALVEFRLDGALVAGVQGS